MHPIVSKWSTKILGNALVRPITEELPMIRLTTRSGCQIVMTPESLFGLEKRHGSPIIRTNPVVHPLAPMHFKPHLIADEFDAQDPRWWYILGLTTAAGFIPENTAPTVASYIILPKDRRRELELLATFLQAYFDKFESMNYGQSVGVGKASGRVPEIKITDSWAGSTLTARAINLIAQRIMSFCFPLKSYGSELYAVSGDPDLKFLEWAFTDDAYAGFMAGILAGSDLDTNGRVFKHRNSHFVKVLSERLFHDFGIPTEVDIQQYEPVKFRKNKSVRIHTFTLHRRHYLKVHAAGLVGHNKDLLTGGGEQTDLRVFADRVFSIEPAGYHEGIEVTGDTVAVINNFVFNLNFEPHEGAMSFAAMEELFTDVANPAEVIANAKPALADNHGVI